MIAFIFAVILGGSTRLKIALQLDQSLAGVMQGLIVLMVLLGDGVRQRWLARNSKDAPVTPEQGFQPITPPEALPHE